MCVLVSSLSFLFVWQLPKCFVESVYIFLHVTSRVDDVCFFGFGTPFTKIVDVCKDISCAYMPVVVTYVAPNRKSERKSEPLLLKCDWFLCLGYVTHLRSFVSDKYVVWC